MSWESDGQIARAEKAVEPPRGPFPEMGGRKRVLLYQARESIFSVFPYEHRSTSAGFAGLCQVCLCWGGFVSSVPAALWRQEQSLPIRNECPGGVEAGLHGKKRGGHHPG